MFVKCTCQHAYQDKRYGRFIRVANLRGRGRAGTVGTYRCTVCSAEHAKAVTPKRNIPNVA
ncbi:MAG: hypothetical protein ACXADY_23080 [Candidatus Hodarchaeales archaeon]|jgi:hypothetical protein